MDLGEIAADRIDARGQKLCDRRIFAVDASVQREENAYAPFGTGPLCP